MKERDIKARLRADRYAERYQTRIYSEQAGDQNPFIEEEVRLYGYDIHELAENISYTDTIYLLLKGELPDAAKSTFLRKLAVYFIHPGVRHEASRAAVLGGVGKTLPSHVLPLSLLVYGGDRTGTGKVEALMKFLSKARRQSPEDFLQTDKPWPGFSDYYGGRDQIAVKICENLVREQLETETLEWLLAVDKQLERAEPSLGVTRPLVAAAAFADLGFLPRVGPPLLQILAAPGLLAQGFEHANKPATVLPFVTDENYSMSS